MGNTYSVTQINGYIKNLFQQDFMLGRISVRGEVSNCKYHGSGHIYFTLKDEKSSIGCVMFASSRKGLAFPMGDGDRVAVTGSVDVYERDGRYQMYARSIVKEGAGILYERFLALKAELEEMGMFSPEYKQPIPKYVNTIGIVTSPTGAAVQDIRNIAGRRNPFVQLILYPALVQGEGAAESICRGIETLDAMHPDVIIVGRGGGSLEDLWAFNEEAVARAIFRCSTPVISAVGHETDTSISDYAADLYAPTPSAAAELAVKDIRETLGQKEEYRRRLKSLMAAKIREEKFLLNSYQGRWKTLSPENQIREKCQRLVDLEQRLRTLADRILEEKRMQLQLRIGQLKGCSPLDRLNQGYSFMEKEQKPVQSVSQLKTGDLLKIYVRDGSLLAEVREIQPEAGIPVQTADRRIVTE